MSLVDKHKIEALLADEEKILCELIEVNTSLACAEEIEQADIDRAFELRSEIMKRLHDCEAKADELGRRSLAPADLRQLALNLMALCEKAERSEKLAMAKVEVALEQLKKEALAIGQGLNGFRRYQGPVSHLSRFTDRTG